MAKTGVAYKMLRILHEIRGSGGQTDRISPYAMQPEELATYFAGQLSPIERLFVSHRGRTVHKWVHYLPIYDRLFAPFCGSELCFLELGVSQGGSLEMWRNYFGPRATIAGVDINELCATRFDPPNRVFIGSQADPEFLRRTVDEIGRPHIILDDGSHVAEHQRVSFATLFPLLRDGGLYVIEDTHSSYWPEDFQGGYRRGGTAIEFAKELVDHMHAWYHPEHFDPEIRDNVLSVSFYDSIIVIEKAKQLPPRHVQIPGEQPSRWKKRLDQLLRRG